jgi:hypothetical protein
LAIDTLYTNGCSWTFGHGLSSDPEFPILPTPQDIQKKVSELSWPGLLSKYFNANLINESAGGGSNSRIVRTTCDFIRNYPPEKYGQLFVVIGWTAPQRNEIYVEYNKKGTWHIFNPGHPFDAQFSGGELPYPPHVMKNLSRYHEIYARLIQSDHADFTRFFNQIFLLSNLLDNLKIKHLFFSSIGFPYIKDKNTHDKFSKEFAAISDLRYLNMHQKYCMAEFCRERNIPLSPCLHPMIKGHDLWSKKLIMRITKVWPNIND